jgi:hypothetical protein
MAIHDRYARVTPYELLLPEESFADERFPLILKEGEERGGGFLDNPDPFALLAEAGSVLRDIRGEEEDPRLIQHHGALLFHAFHFWRNGCPLFLLAAPVARYLVDSGPREGGWSPSLPGAAGYVQLPHHLFWIPGGDDTPPESLDGFFWSAPDPDQISLLLVMGMRKERPGLSVVPLPTLPLSAAGVWASLQVRPQGKDFQSSLPGSELEHLYAVEAGAEAVKLAMRVFWYLDSYPGSVERGERGEVGGATGRPEASVGPQGSEAAGGPDEGPRPSALDCRRIVMGG